MTAGPPRIWKLGDQCQIVCPDGRKVDAEVQLASSNGFSLALAFEAIVGGWVAMMPLLWSATRERFEDFHGEPFELKEPPHAHG
jgi:hypothetical protein